MRFIVDESTGAAVVAYLRDAGHDVLAVAETMPQAADFVILDLASKQSRILISNDKDFGELVFRSGRSHAGVLLLRLRDESAAARVRAVKAVMERYPDHLSGRFVVANETTVRLRSPS